MKLRVEARNSRQRFTLELEGRAVLGRGGEARILRVPGDRTLAAKIYHAALQPSSPTSASKLKSREAKTGAMLANPPVDPTRDLNHISIAWPTDLLYEERESRFVGFMMPRVEGLFSLFSVFHPSARRVQHPHFTYQGLHRVSQNLCAAVEAVHAVGHVVGDLNESNALVSDQCLVTLVDTDSFQIRSPADGQVFPCPVGKVEYTPAELQGVELKSVPREASADLFALGVLVYQLLMEGSHPFRGVGEPSELSKRIANGLFAYGPKGKPPPMAPAIQHLDAGIQQLIVRCFEGGFRYSGRRPSASEWKAALEVAEKNLVPCSQNSQHLFVATAGSCPWCARTRQLGFDPFPSRSAVKRGAHLKRAGVQRPLRPSFLPGIAPTPGPRHVGVSARSRPAPQVTSSAGVPRKRGGAGLLLVGAAALALVGVLRGWLPFSQFGANRDATGTSAPPAHDVLAQWESAMVPMSAGLAGTEETFAPPIVVNLEKAASSRRSPSEDASRSQEYRIGAEIRLLGFANGWYCVEASNGACSAWIDAQDVPLTRPGEALRWWGERDISPDLSAQATDRLNLRRGPGTNYEVQLVVEKGTPLWVEGRLGDWCRTNPVELVWASCTYLMPRIEAEPGGVKRPDTLALDSLDSTEPRKRIAISAPADSCRLPAVDIWWVDEGAFSSNGEIVAACQRNKVFAWRSEDCELLVGEELTPCGSLALGETGKVMAGGKGERGAVQIWDLGQRQSPRALDMADTTITALAVSESGGYIAGGSLTGEASVWSTDSMSLVASLPRHNGRVGAAAFAASGSLLATGSTGTKQAEVRIWEIPSGRLRERFDVGGENRAVVGVSAIAFDPTGRLLAVGAWDLGYLIDLEKRQILRRLEGEPSQFQSIDWLSFSPDSSLLVGARPPFSTIVWDVETGLEVGSLFVEGVESSVGKESGFASAFLGRDSFRVLVSRDRQGANLASYFVERLTGDAFSFSQRWEVLKNGKAVTAPLRLHDQRAPHDGNISKPSPSGRYVLVNLCGEDWCDDTRILDLERGRSIREISGFSLGGKSGGSDWVSWSPDERFLLLAWGHAGWVGINAIDLVRLSGTSLDLQSLVEGEPGDIDPPDSVRERGSTATAAVDLGSVEWTSDRRIRLEVDILKTLWKGNSGMPVVSRRDSLAVALPGLDAIAVERGRPADAPSRWQPYSEKRRAALSDQGTEP